MMRSMYSSHILYDSHLGKRSSLVDCRKTDGRNMKASYPALHFQVLPIVWIVPIIYRNHNKHLPNGDENEHHDHHRVEENEKKQPKMTMKPVSPTTVKNTPDCVGAECSRDMRMLVKNGKETKEEVTTGSMEKHKTELGIFHRDQKEHNDHKAKVIVIILGQCSSKE